MGSGRQRLFESAGHDGSALLCGYGEEVAFDSTATAALCDFNFRIGNSKYERGNKANGTIALQGLVSASLWL